MGGEGTGAALRRQQLIGLLTIERGRRHRLLLAQKDWRSLREAAIPLENPALTGFLARRNPDLLG
jgi:hypothetical protein